MSLNISLFERIHFSTFNYQTALFYLQGQIVYRSTRWLIVRVVRRARSTSVVCWHRGKAISLSLDACVDIRGVFRRSREEE